MNNLSGKCAIVTGASKGIGSSIAVELASLGAYVIVNYNSDLLGAEKTMNYIRELGGIGCIFKADVSNYKEVEELFKCAVDKYGKVDILVNNAGISKVGLFIDLEEEQWNKLIDVNIKGMINCSHIACRHMIENKAGSIINISSIWGDIGASCEVVYSGTKGAVNSFTKALAKEMGPSNIRVNAVSPGVINTEMNSWLSQDEKNELVSEIPLCRMGEGNDIGKIVAFLAGGDSAYITGQIMRVDGGFI